MSTEILDLFLKKQLPEILDRIGQKSLTTITKLIGESNIATNKKLRLISIILIEMSHNSIMVDDSILGLTKITFNLPYSREIVIEVKFKDNQANNSCDVCYSFKRPQDFNSLLREL